MNLSPGTCLTRQIAGCGDVHGHRNTAARFRLTLRPEVEECIKFILDRLIEAKDDGPAIEASDMTGDTACGRTDIRGVLIAFISSIAQATTVAVCGIICLCVALVSLCLLCCGHSATAQATDPSPPVRSHSSKHATATES